jgi:hypothetical protein
LFSPSTRWPSENLRYRYSDEYGNSFR